MATIKWEKNEKLVRKHFTSVRQPDHNLIEVNPLGKRMVRKNKPKIKL